MSAACFSKTGCGEASLCDLPLVVGGKARPRLARFRMIIALISLAAWTMPGIGADYSAPGETTAEEEVPFIEVPKRYNIPLGSGGVNLSTGLKGLYVDNVYLSHTSERDDFVIIPELNVASFFPVGQSNTIVLDLGIAYYEYLKNSSLNSGTPLINPNSEIAFNLRVKDFTFRFSERFFYEESPVYETGAEFFNVYNTGRFAHFENRVGVLGSWDLHDLAVSAGYYHENLFSNGSQYNYIDHASELFSTDAILALGPRLKTGLEAAGSLNRFENRVVNDSWRVRFGPTVRWDVSSFVKARLGAGYERIQYDSVEASALGIAPENTYYAYAEVEHEINQFLSHSLRVSHDNQLGYNAGNLAGTHVEYSFTWQIKEPLSLSPHLTVIFYEESFGSGPPTLYHEKFNYVLAGFSARYRLGQHWRASLGWDYRLKDSEFEDAGYAQNQVSIELMYQF